LAIQLARIVPRLQPRHRYLSVIVTIVNECAGNV
jgi:hypothetical protein